MAFEAVVAPGDGDVPVASLTGTAKSLAALASLAGYEVRAKRFLGFRIPRQVSQPRDQRIVTTVVVGEAGGWAFFAFHNPQDGWDIVLHRPGWPRRNLGLMELRAQLKAQTPAVIR